jgi:hypothetical protein
MPKEIINYTDDAASFSVHWSGPEGGQVLQLGITIPRKSIEEYIRGLESAKSGDHVVEWYSFPLERGEVQRLIRAAKRARDAVFGADE